MHTIILFIRDLWSNYSSITSYSCKVGLIGPATVGGIKPGCMRIGNTGGMLDNIVMSKVSRYATESSGGKIVAFIIILAIVLTTALLPTFCRPLMTDSCIDLVQWRTYRRAGVCRTNSTTSLHATLMACMKASPLEAIVTQEPDLSTISCAIRIILMYR